MSAGIEGWELGSQRAERLRREGENSEVRYESLTNAARHVDGCRPALRSSSGGESDLSRRIQEVRI